MIYLHESDVSCKALAIDLCSRGFSVWQHYVDSMEMLRSLFNLATSMKKESISAQNVGPQARQAVLHIVTDHTGIFMTTLSLDILHPQSLEHRKSVMQLMAFLIRKVGYVFFSVSNQNLLIYFSLRNLLSSFPIFQNLWKRW
jgi:rabconnectin-3b